MEGVIPVAWGAVALAGLLIAMQTAILYEVQRIREAVGRHGERLARLEALEGE